MKSILFLAVVLCCSAASAHDLSQEQLNRLYYEAGLAEFKKNGSAFAALEKESQESIKKLKLDRSLIAAQRKEKYDQLSEAVANARKAKKHFKTWTMPKIHFEAAVNKGDIGSPYVHSHVQTVEVLQVLDAKSAIVKTYGYWWKLENYPTDNIADGDTLRLTDVYYCSGNYRYTTVSGGSKTVLVLERIPTKEVAICMEYATEQQK
jgi:opacity protein-like surface antigen